MPFNDVASSKMVIGRPYSYATIARAMAVNENNIVQKHSNSVDLLFNAGEFGSTYIEVQLRGTVILWYYENGLIAVNAGNWYTKWTRMYLNEWLRGVACISANGRDPWTLTYNGKTKTFFNNMIINTKLGIIEGIGFDVEGVKAHNRDIDKLIDKWFKELEPTDLEDIVEYNAGYRCDECEDYGHHATGHIKEHLVKGEYVGSMFCRAWLEMKQTPGYLSMVARGMHRNGELNNDLKRYITRWLRRQLYIGPITF
jgi:hypothetical protein